MAKVISKRGQDIIDKREAARRLDEKYMIKTLPLSEEEQRKIERIFEHIREELERIA